MRKILLVDDNYTDQTIEAANIINKIEDYELVRATSVTDAIKECKKSNFDILITDIQLPTRLGGNIDKQGGLKLVEALEERSQSIRIPSYVIGITSHPESLSSSQSFFNDRGFKIILASEIGSQLPSILESQLKYLPVQDEFDVAIITALHETEFDKILDLDLDLKVLETIGSHTYYSGSFLDSEGTKRSVIATYCTRMGCSSAAASTSYLISRYKPKLVAMTGITGGINNDLSFGDIVVADSCWDWESGKRTTEEGESIFKTASDQIRLNERICASVKSCSINRKFVDQIQNNWKAQSPSSRLSLHVGPMVSGSSVMEDQEIVSEILKQHRKILAIEMEAYGVALAVNIAPTPTNFLILKSVSDLANKDKNDDYRDYAAYTSAQFLYSYLVNEFYCLDIF